MKKTVFILLIFMVCTIQAMAYEYFTIYFSDGTKSEAFYATDVDSICYSKLSLDGIAFDEWQVQEIYTVDSVYRYPLAQIDSLSFKDVDANRVAKDIAHVTTAVTPIYAECESIEDISQHLPEIRTIEGIEDVWINNQTLYVKIRDWGTITYGYKSEDEPFSGVFAQEGPSLINKRGANTYSESSHQDYTEEIVNMCVINQQYRDEERKSRSEAETLFINICTKWGLAATPLNNPSPEFFAKDIYDYDFIFLMTHGSYDEKTGLHWILTGEQLYVANEDGIVDKNVFELKVREIFEKKYPLSKEVDIVSDYITIGSYKEIRNGVRVPVYYTKISNKWISLGGQDFKHPGKAIVFNTSCQSLMGNDANHDNDNMANAFFKRGAGLYLGYNQESGGGHIAGNGFLSGLINGKSSYASFLSIPKKYRDYTFYSEAQRKNVHPILKYKLNPQYKYDICLTHPVTFDAKPSDESYSYTLEGEIKTYMPLCNFYGNNSCNDEVLKNTYGFLVSNSPEMTNAEQNNVDLLSDDISYDNYILSWRTTIDKFGNQKLQPNTTYYYRAYMNDGYSDCYGEIKEFTTGGDAAAYYVIDGNSMTYYYDEFCKERHGTKIEKEHFVSSYESTFQTSFPTLLWVIFDSSFANYYPTKFSFAGCVRLNEIENLNYLKTDSICDMASMFEDCYRLKNLDVSSFDTSNVTDMNSMFVNCESLTSLDLSSFDTSNVTDMNNMFVNCKSLTSLDLSSFDTSNVTNMKQMFSSCTSLTSLDLSIFNTSNVTDMKWMFWDCSSLTSLNLNSFNTSNVTNMASMFWGCGSLMSLDLSSFDTSNVTILYGMFGGCSSLVNLDLSNFDLSNIENRYYFWEGCNSLISLKLGNAILPSNCYGLFSQQTKLREIDLSNVNTSNVTTMESMFEGCSFLTSLDLSSFDMSNVKRVNGMFRECSALRTIYAGNWSDANINFYNGYEMFKGCTNLVGGKGTKLGDNLYGYDKDGKPLYYECPSDGSAAHIDGGKDWPGLFTAK